MANWDMSLAVKHLVANAKASPIGYCAMYVRQAIEAGGVTLTRHTSAKDYGSSLIAVGFRAITEAVPERGHKGDVVVMQAIGTHIHGHMQMYSGSAWVSDYTQNGFYPYSVSRPEYQVYRYPSPHEPQPSNPTPDFGYGIPEPAWSITPPATPGSPSGGGGTGGGTPVSAPGGSTAAYPGKALRWGSQGSDVARVQRRLTQHGWTLTDDGAFGKLTSAAVKSFQQTNQLYADGVVGPNTWRALFA